MVYLLIKVKKRRIFCRLELEKREKAEDEKFKQVAEEEKRKLRALYFIRCSKCSMELGEIDFKGIHVDKCFQCEGIWLDVGELELIAKLEKEHWIYYLEYSKDNLFVLGIFISHMISLSYF